MEHRLDLSFRYGDREMAQADGLNRKAGDAGAPAANHYSNLDIGLVIVRRL